MTQLDVKVTVDLPGPTLRGIQQNDRVYVAQKDVVEWIIETADAFDAGHAHSDLGKAFRAAAESLSAARPIE